MRAQINLLFPDSNDCLQTYTDKRIKIFNAEEAPCYVGNSIDENFLVINNNDNEICFVAVDYCLFNGGNNYGQRCECVVFDNDTFCFIELKNTETSTGRTARSNRKTAKGQILNTYLEFANSGIDFGQYILEAYIAFLQRPIILGAATILEASFELSHYNITLYQSSSKSF